MTSTPAMTCHWMTSCSCCTVSSAARSGRAGWQQAVGRTVRAKGATVMADALQGMRVRERALMRVAVQEAYVQGATGMMMWRSEGMMIRRYA